MAAAEFVGLVAAAWLPALERKELALAVKWPLVEVLARYEALAQHEVSIEALTLSASVWALELDATVTVRPSAALVAVELTAVVVASPVD